MTKKIFDIIPPKTTLPKEKKLEVLSEKISHPSFYCPYKKLNYFIVIIFILLILTGIFFHFFLAKAKVEIWPKTQTLNFQEKIIIDSQREESDFSKKKIGGKVFEEKRRTSQKFLASGKVKKEGRAEGIIRVYNNYHLPQVLVQNTRFQPPLEKVLYFRSVERVVVPAKGELDIKVRADRPGPEYNIGPSTFSLPGLTGLPQYYSIYGKSFQPMTGGYLGQVSQVTEEDLETAKKTLLEKLERESKDYLKMRFSEEFILLEEGVWSEIIEATSSLSAFQEGESFDFTLEIKSKAILVKKSDLDNFAREFIRSQIGQDQKIVPEKLKIDYSLESIDKTAGKIILNLKISTQIYSDIDFNLLKKGLAKKLLKEAEILLGDYPQIEKAQIKIFPFWLKRIPDDLRKIKIETKFD